MNKSEIELANVQAIIDEMPVAERALCVSMISSLMASVGHPVHGRIFMIAVAFTNCQVAVHNIKMGLVNEDGSIPEKFMQGDGKVKATQGEKGFHSGGYTTDSNVKENEAEGVVAKPVAMVQVFNPKKGILEFVPFDPVDPNEILKAKAPKVSVINKAGAVDVESARLTGSINLVISKPGTFEA